MNGFSVATVGERIKLRSDTSTTTPDKKPLHLSPVTFSTGSLPKVGQAVILVSGEDGGSADYGIVSSLIERTEEEVSVRRIKTSIPLGSGDQEICAPCSPHLQGRARLVSRRHRGRKLVDFL